MPDLDLAHLRQWIDKPHEREDVVTPRLVESYRATLGPHLADVDGGPLGLHWCVAPDLVDAASLGPDGHAAKGGFLPPVPLPRRMWAGSEVEFIAPLVVGDAVVRRSTVRSVEEKLGRTGRLCFVTVEHAIAGRAGPAIREVHTIVYRGADPPASTRAPKPVDGASAPHRRDVAIDPVMMFRYSALTFNGHRIHYDAPYATEVEGYGGLVIHGPLQATLLLNLAAGIAGSGPRRFSFKGVAPAVGTQTLRLHAWENGDRGLTLESLGSDGASSVKATAQW